MMKKKIVVAIDSFKGCLSSTEANEAARRGLADKCADIEILQIPVSDGGEGWTEAFYAAIGGQLIETEVSDPLMRCVKANYLQKDRLAVIEIAQASGLTLLKPEERNPLKATTYGTGELIADAIRKGCREFIIGLGGSATSDAGRGMLQALADAFCNGNVLKINDVLKDMHFCIATDVNNPLCGPLGAAHVFAPQKGATLEMVEVLDQRAREFARESAIALGYDCAEVPGAGAAGGLGYAFMQYLHAERRQGIDLLLDTIGFDQLLLNACMVITGEGSADRQTLMGKLPSGIMQRAKSQGVPTVLVAGKVADRDTLLSAGFSQVWCINPPGTPLEVALRKEEAEKNIAVTVARLLS